MKITTQSSTSLCSYLPQTSNILLTNLLSITFNLISSIDLTEQILRPHKITGTMSDL